MIWKKFDARRSGECWIDLAGEQRARYEVGVVETPRSRVYAGRYLKITMSDGRTWIGEDRWSPLVALHDVAGQIERDGGTLMCAGLDPRFYESGLSQHTGHGYIEGWPTALHMMEPSPPHTVPASSIFDAGIR